MILKKMQLVKAYDDDDGAVGWLIGVAIGLAIALFVLMCICSIGVLIGAFLSIKNYVLAFVENVKPGELDEYDIARDNLTEGVA